jgi:hypothetical protein
MNEILLHAKMESDVEINSPTIYTERVAGWENGAAVWESGSGDVTYEQGIDGLSARLKATSWSNMENLVFAPENFDFSDVSMDGGMLDFWMKFNVDPHIYAGNKFIFRTMRIAMGPVTMEIYGSDPYIAFEFFNAENGNNPATNYRFMVYSKESEEWRNWDEGEWHRITVTWKRNPGDATDELHMFIDGKNENCNTCNDYNGILPAEGTWEGMYFGNNGTLAIDFTIDELRSHSFIGSQDSTPPLPPTGLTINQ